MHHKKIIELLKSKGWDTKKQSDVILSFFKTTELDATQEQLASVVESHDSADGSTVVEMLLERCITDQNAAGFYAYLNELSPESVDNTFLATLARATCIDIEGLFTRYFKVHKSVALDNDDAVVLEAAPIDDDFVRHEHAITMAECRDAVFTGEFWAVGDFEVRLFALSELKPA